MRRSRDSDKSREAGSNNYERGRLDYIRKIYMESHARIERKFLAMIRAHDLSSRDKLFSLMSYREGAMEILSAVHEIFGLEGLSDVSKHLRAGEDSAAGRNEDDGPEEDADEEGEDDSIPTPPGKDFCFENCDPAHVRPWEKLEDDRFPFKLIDREDEEEPSGPEPDDEEGNEDEGEELALDIIARVANWEEVRGLWKGFDPAYR